MYFCFKVQTHKLPHFSDWIFFKYVFFQPDIAKATHLKLNLLHFNHYFILRGVKGGWIFHLGGFISGGLNFLFGRVRVAEIIIWGGVCPTKPGTPPHKDHPGCWHIMQI